MKSLVVFILLMACGLFASASPEASPSEIQYFRDLTNQIRKDASFTIAFGAFDQELDYHLEFADPMYPMPKVSQAGLGLDPKKFYRAFWDRIALKDTSYIMVGGKKILLTCVFVQGQDNRFAGKIEPNLPQILLKVYLVANDPTCVGPLTPNYPDSGGYFETWSTYLYFEVENIDKMWPKMIRFRNHWNELCAEFVK